MLPTNMGKFLNFVASALGKTPYWLMGSILLEHARNHMLGVINSRAPVATLMSNLRILVSIKARKAYLSTNLNNLLNYL